jgi:hypothetical protein
MPIISSSLRAAAAFSLLTRLSVPIVLAMGGGAVAQGCLSGASSVALGKLYVSENPTYDEFFSALYQIQLPMGQASDREAGNRARVANALGIPVASSPEEIGDALDQRAVGITKAGVTLKVRSSGLEAGNASAELMVTGSASKPADQALISTLGQSLKDEALLVSELRGQRPQIDRLKPQADSLEPGIDVTFRKGGGPKKSEVRKNVIDAQRILPLMSQRSEDLEHLAKDFVQKVQKVLGAVPVAAPAPPPPAPAPAEEKPAATPPPKKGAGKAKPGSPHTEATPPKPKAEEGEPAEEKPTPKPEPKAKPPADDFEP